MQQYGCALQYVPEEMKHNENVMLAAVQQVCYYYYYCTSSSYHSHNYLGGSQLLWLLLLSYSGGLQLLWLPVQVKSFVILHLKFANPRIIWAAH